MKTRMNIQAREALCQNKPLFLLLFFLFCSVSISFAQQSATGTLHLGHSLSEQAYLQIDELFMGEAGYENVAVIAHFSADKNEVLLEVEGIDEVDAEADLAIIEVFDPVSGYHSLHVVRIQGSGGAISIVLTDF